MHHPTFAYKLGLIVTSLYLSTAVLAKDTTPERDRGQGFQEQLLQLANSKLLPENFTVGVSTDPANPYVVNHTRGRNLQPTVLPTVNAYTKTPGCYVACYSRNEDNAVYSVGGGISVMGQFRLAGAYGKDPASARVCVPEGYEGEDISAEKSFSQECTRHFPEACANDSCWVGGDTGGWFGIR